jgi:protein involved in polysaccharide export with SLBB domain
VDDPTVLPGDIIYVPENRDEVTVVGEVTRPGTMDYKENMTVTDALTVAGPVLSDADLVSGVLTHNGVDTPINLDLLLNHPDTTPPIQLSPGDRLLVPQVKRTYVFGDVLRAGSYNYKPGDRVSDALSAAGPGPSAKLSDVNLVRIANDKNSAVVSHVDYQEFLDKGTMADNVLLEPGDTLYIRPVKQKFNLSQLGAALQGVNLLNTSAYIASNGLGH